VNFEEIGLEVDEGDVFRTETFAMGNGNDVIELTDINDIGKYYIGKALIQMNMDTPQGLVPVQTMEVLFVIADAGSVQEAFEKFDEAFEAHVERKEKEANDEQRVIRAPSSALNTLGEQPGPSIFRG